MRDRVACERCGAHKDAAVWQGPCLVCGSARFKPVPPSPGDFELGGEHYRASPDARSLGFPPAPSRALLSIDRLTRKEDAA